MSTKEQFWDLLCGYMPALVGLLWVYVILAVLTAFSLLYISRGSGSFVVAVIDAALILTSSVVVLAFYRTCKKRRREV